MPKPTYLLLLGPPGSGKGTQARILRDALGIVHIASGDLFRENIRNETDLGKEAKRYIDRGELVPDGLTIAMVMSRLHQPDTEAGVLLDGFPRTLPQAEALDSALAAEGNQLAMVLSIKVSEDVLVERISGRLFCRVGGESYHEIFNPPQVPGVCDQDGGELYRRDDDEPETVKNRIQVYLRQTNPLIEYYQARGILVDINGDQPITQVEEEILATLKEKELMA
ncbi:MAG: adenylate kinase [Anaerolineales bacterium]|nr:adenylate kinase [Anaerolineales bacterium]